MNKQLYEKIGEEYKPINPIIKLDNIIDSISENSILSMLLKSNHYYIEYSNSIKATRNKVPLSLRRKGLWISYINGKEDITECFIGKNDEIDEHWSDDNNWKNLTYIKVEEGSITYQHLNDNLKRNISEYKNITNCADDEDLMTEGNVLKLANKEYNPNTFSGLGEVIIRKNIKNINGKNKNIITNYNFDKENTIYIIKYDFDLNDNTINIPENSVLQYKGGSLNNGKIVYNNTIIEGIERLNNIITEGDYTYPLKALISTERPTTPHKGMYHFDTSLSKPIWWNGTKWVDATGAEV